MLRNKLIAPENIYHRREITYKCPTEKTRIYEKYETGVSNILPELEELIKEKGKVYIKVRDISKELNISKDIHATTLACGLKPILFKKGIAMATDTTVDGEKALSFEKYKEKK